MPKSIEEKVAKQKQHEEEDRKISEFFKIECDDCHTKCSTFLEVKSHYRKIHGKSRAYLSCCNKKFFRRGGLLEHITLHINPEVFK